MSNVFNADQQQTPEPVLPAAPEQPTVAELQKQIEELRKSKAHADPLIESLRRQVDELKEDMGGMVKPDQILEEIKKISQTRSTEGNGADTPAAVDPDVVSRLVEETVNKKQAAAVATANLSRVDAEVRKLYGDKSKEFVAQKSEELGVPLDELAGIAARSPDAFFRIVGMSVEKKPAVASLPEGTINTAALNSGSSVEQGTFKWYQKLRRDDPKTYYSARTQQQMLRDAEKLGTKFYE